MRTRPILFSGPMVSALLAGTKTQTRRILKASHTAISGAVDVRWLPNWNQFAALMPTGGNVALTCPYGVPGDRLWVRETWRVNAALDERSPAWFAPKGQDDRAFVRYEADGAHTVPPGCSDGVWGKTRVSIHMPRWASRLTLEITDVRVERLQAISEADAKAEGLGCITKDGSLYKYGIPDRDGLPGTDNDGWAWSNWQADPRLAYAALWEGINGNGSWAANPWVWALTFKRVTA